MAKEIKWQAPEFIYRRKTLGWYWLTIFAAVALIGIAVWQKNFLFGIFIVIAEILVLVWAEKPPRLVPMALTREGVAIEGALRYPYLDLASFTVDDREEEPFARLGLRFKNFRPPAAIQVPKEKLADVKAILRIAVPYVEGDRSFFDALEEFTNF